MSFNWNEMNVIWHPDQSASRNMPQNNPPQNAPQAGSFDWNQMTPLDQVFTSPTDPNQRITDEDLQNMSMQEKLELMKDLAFQRQAEVGGAFVRGATLGASGHLEKGARERGTLMGEAPTGTGAVELAGELAPIAGIGAGLTAAAKYAAPTISAMRGFDILTSIGTGASYATAKKAISEGKPIEGKEALKEGLIFGAAHLGTKAAIAGAKAIGKGYKWARGLFEGPKPEEIINPMISGAPESPYLAQSEAAEALHRKALAEHAQKVEAAKKIAEAENLAAQAEYQKALNTSTQNAPKTQTQTTAQPPIKTARARSETEQIFNDVIYPERIVDPAIAGEQVARNFRKLQKDAWEAVNHVYTASKEGMRGIQGERGSLLSKLQARTREWRGYPPNSQQAHMASEAKRISEKLIIRNPETKAVQMRPDVTQESLINEIQNINLKLRDPYMPGDQKNMWRVLRNDLEEGVTQFNKDTGNEEATKIWNEARALRRQYSETFDNKYVEKFTDTQNYDFIKNLESLEDPDTFRRVQSLILQMPGGQQISTNIEREIVNNKLGKYFENPLKHNPQDIAAEIDKLSSVISPERQSQLRQMFEVEFSGAQLTPGGKAPPPAPKTPQAPVQKVPKPPTPKTPKEIKEPRKLKASEIERKFNDVDDIKEMRKALPSEIFQKNRLNKGRDILYGGNFKDRPTGNQVVKRMLDLHDRDILIELYGKKNYDIVLKMAEEAGEKELTKEFVKTVATKAGIASGGAGKLIFLLL